jgi:hypothetical protein
MSTGNIYQQFAHIAAKCRTELPAKKADGRDALYNTLLALFNEKQVMCLPRTQSHTFEVINPKPGESLGVTTVRAEFDFVATDGSILTSGAVGVYSSPKLLLSNEQITIAQRYALIAVFLLPTAGNAPVAQLNTEAPPEPTNRAQMVAATMNKEKGGVAKTMTADQLQPVSPSQRAEATRAMQEWRTAIQGLPDHNPAAWTAHLTKLGSLPLLKPQNRQELFEELVEAASAVYIGFDSAETKFFLAELPADITT